MQALMSGVKQRKKRNRNQDTIIYLLNVLAAHYLSSYLSERDLSKKEELHEKMVTEINNADHYRMDENMIIIKKGFSMFAGGMLSTAKRYFDNAIEMDSKNVIALFGKGCMAYNQNDFKEALKIFQHIFKLHPQTSLNVRAGIGLCFYKLGDFRKAQMAFERCLQLNPQDYGSMVYLGIIALRQGLDCIPKALELFQRAYQINPNNPLCLLQLANHYYYIGDLGRAETLAKKALIILDCYKLIKSPQQPQNKEEKADLFAQDIHLMRSDLCFIIGKVAHAKEEYPQASKMYSEALEENPKITQQCSVLAKY